MTSDLSKVSPCVRERLKPGLSSLPLHSPSCHHSHVHPSPLLSSFLYLSSLPSSLLLSFLPPRLLHCCGSRRFPDHTLVRPRNQTSVLVLSSCSSGLHPLPAMAPRPGQPPLAGRRPPSTPPLHPAIPQVRSMSLLMVSCF